MFGLFKSKRGEKSYAVGPAVLNSDSSQLIALQDHSFKKIFEHEVNSWCYGLENLGEAPLPQVVFRVVREFRSVFTQAIEQGFVFDIDQVARRIFSASGQAVPLKELAMALVAILPNPEKLPVERKRTYALVLAQVELSHSGAVERVKQRIQPTQPMTKDQGVDSARQAPQAPLLLAGRV
jgi:hypothetical protein